MELQPIPVSNGVPVYPSAGALVPRPNSRRKAADVPYTPVFINGNPLPIQGVRELKPGMTIDQATDLLTSKKDGLDTIVFTVRDNSGQEKGYLAYGDGFDFSGLKRPEGMLYYNGQPTSVKFIEGESNSVRRGARDGALGAVKGMTDTVIDTAKGVVAGVKPATTIVFGIGAAAAGLALLKGSAIAGAAAAGGGTFAGMASALATTIFPALLVLAGAAVVGSLFVAGVGAFGGAVDAMRNKHNAEYGLISKAGR